MDKYQEFWHDVGNEIGHASVELDRILELLAEVEDDFLTRDFVKIEFFDRRAELIRQVVHIEDSITELQKWIRENAMSAGAPLN